MTTKRISPELFNKLVGLAALELTAEESAYLFEEMNHQLASVEALTTLTEVEPSCGLSPNTLCGPMAAFPNPEAVIAQPETEDE